MTWIDIKPVDFSLLKKARLQTHQAVQLLAATAISFAEKKEDDSHTNLEWLPDLSAFAGTLFGSPIKLRLAFQPHTFDYFLLGDKNNILDSISIQGKSESDAVSWLKDSLTKQNINSEKFTLKKHYQIPHVDQGDGAKYDVFNTDIFRTLSAHFANANSLFKSIASQFKDVSPVRCWPHHFDLALTLTLNKSKSIGVGLSPGDENYYQPYYYVYPWPYPEEELVKTLNLPENSFWHTTGFVSAIFTSEMYLKEDNPAVSIKNFLNKAIRISQEILD